MASDDVEPFADVDASKLKQQANDAQEARTLTSQQVESACNRKRRQFVTAIICIAGFLDVAGAVILQPAVPMMMSNAKQATRPTSWPDGYKHPQAFPEDSFNGVTYAFAINLVLVVNQFAATLSNFAMGAASDRFGCKPILACGVLMGSVTMLLYYIAGVVMKSFWAFICFLFINGLFGGSRTVIAAYAKDLWGPEFAQVQPILMLCFLLGGAAGGVIGGTVSSIVPVDSISGNLFLGALIAAGLSFLSFLSILAYVPELPRLKKAGGKEDKTAKPLVTRLVRRILLTVVVANLLDSFGDQGNTFARNTIFSNRYPQGKEVTINMAMLVIKLLGVLVAMFIVLSTQKRTGLAFWCITGNFFSAACQLAIIPNGMPLGGFVAIWTVAQLVGFTSTMAANFLVPQFAPPESMGYWTGMMNSAFTFGQTTAPLILAAIYSGVAPDAGSPASEYQDAELACLITCGSVSVLAFIFYLPLPSLIPRGDTIVPFEKKPEEVYENMSEKDFSKLSHAEQKHVNFKRVEEGKPALLAHWLPYDDDREDGSLTTLLERSRAEFQGIQNDIKGLLTNRSKMQRITNNIEKFREMDTHYDKEKERSAMGAWLTGYLDDAGYHMWMRYPDVFKAMMMNAFPPLDELDGEKFTFKTEGEFEIYMMSWLRVLDGHLRQHQVTASVAGLRNAGNWLSRSV